MGEPSSYPSAGLGSETKAAPIVFPSGIPLGAKVLLINDEYARNTPKDGSYLSITCAGSSVCHIAVFVGISSSSYSEG